MKKQAFQTKYQSKKPDADGYISYTDEENKIWEELITRQLKIIKGKACDEFIQGMLELSLPLDRVPQLPQVSEILLAKTGWKLESVPSLISFEEFFGKLSRRIFPVATFIRSRKDFDYLQEPDLFHELFGHCPMLLNREFADFTQSFGSMALKASHEEQEFLGRLYWFTAEFGLISTRTGLKIYGGGILSSPSETVLSLENKYAQRKPFDILKMLRTPYRIDIVQPVYFTLKSLKDLMNVVDGKLYAAIQKARKLGMFEPAYGQ